MYESEAITERRKDVGNEVSSSQEYYEEEKKSFWGKGNFNVLKC